MHADATTYLDIARNKQDQRQRCIPKAWHLSQDQLQSCDILNVPQHCGILDTREIHITQDCDAFEIVKGIANRSLSAKEVTVAFCKRAAIAQQLVNLR